MTIQKFLLQEFKLNPLFYRYTYTISIESLALEIYAVVVMYSQINKLFI
jgi:hypothetical protein